MNSMEHFGLHHRLEETPEMVSQRSHMVPVAPGTNRIFSKPKDNEATNEKYELIASRINQDQMEASQRAMQMLLRRENTLLGGDRHKEQLTMRGHLDDLEKVCGDMVSELKYHRQQL